MKRQLVFIGGGHTHVLVLKRWARNPLPDVELSLISPSHYTPYSGMLPGLVAGHYQFKDAHIDLAALSRACHVRFITACAQRIDVDQKQVQLDNGQVLQCDLLSIDCGSTPDVSVAGAREHSVPVKPIAGFFERWQSVTERVKKEKRRLAIGVVGGGAAGVELIMAMAHYWQNIPSSNSQGRNSTAPELHLIQQGVGLPEHYPARFQAVIAECFRRYGIAVHSNFFVTSVNENGVEAKDKAKSKKVALDEVFWCTHARAPSWPGESGIACSERGFIAVHDSLQSLNHPWIFAAGDVADQVHNPHPKAGVYAVRQAPTLYQNLRRYLRGEKLLSYVPQRQFLNLLACGGNYGVGTKYGLTVKGGWVWRWKDRIDRKFMNQFPLS